MDERVVTARDQKGIILGPEEGGDVFEVGLKGPQETARTGLGGE